MDAVLAPVPSPSPTRSSPVVWPWVPIVLAWGLFLGATFTQQAYLLEHHTWLARADVPLWLATLIFLGTWLLMLTAMMGPCVLAQFNVVVRVSRALGWRAWQIQIPYLTGYLLLWCIFGLIAFVVDLGRLVLTEHWSVLADYTWAVGTVLIGLAAICQFTPWKRRAALACGVRCQPTAVAAPGGAWRTGWQMGRNGIQSDGSLMLIMFGVGMTNLPWLVALTLIMFAEHRAPWRWRAASLAGVSLAVAATFWGILASDAQAAHEGAIQTQTIGATQVTLTVAPAGYGPNTFTVSLVTNQVPLSAATGSLTLSMLDMDMGQQTISLVLQQAGTYRANATLSMPGRWQVVVQMQTASEPITATFVILADHTGSGNFA